MVALCVLIETVFVAALSAVGPPIPSIGLEIVLVGPHILEILAYVRSIRAQGVAFMLEVGLIGRFVGLVAVDIGEIPGRVLGVAVPDIASIVPLILAQVAPILRQVPAVAFDVTSVTANVSFVAPKVALIPPEVSSVPADVLAIRRRVVCCSARRRSARRRSARRSSGRS
jgi:hypothetical protein